MLEIDYQSEDFPTGPVPNGTNTLSVTWDDLLWAAITIGRPNLHYVFMHGEASLYEAIFRLSLMRMALQQEALSGGKLLMTEAFSALDPSEKSGINYFLGMVFCKLFSAQLLETPWLLHLDVFRKVLAPQLLTGKSRPDLVGQNCSTGDWYSFESKGRMKSPSERTKYDAKIQANRLIRVNKTKCRLHIASFSYFRKGALTYYWRDPIAPSEAPIELPEIGNGWRHYYEPAFSLYSTGSEGTETLGDLPYHYLETADILIAIHPKIAHLLRNEEWQRARATASQLRESFLETGYRPDGISIRAGRSWTEQSR